MPSTITHAYFVTDLYDRLDKKKQRMLQPYKEQLKTFAQGPDVLFFYNLLSLKRGKKIRELGCYMHQQKTHSFFVNLIDYIRIKKLENDSEVIAFLYGFMAHYVLDMTIHPLVLFKTGVFDSKINTTHKYFGGHEQMEAYIDAYLMNVRGKSKPKNFKTHTFCFKKTNISLNLEHLIDNVFKKTFDEPSMGINYTSSIKQMKLFYRFFRNDSTGIKKALYTASQILPFKVKMSAISFDIPLNMNDYYLNLSKDSWHHPLDKTEIYNYSFIELYSIALSRALKIIESVDKVLLHKKNLKYLNEIFPNLSYTTGRDCKLGKGEYFSF